MSTDYKWKDEFGDYSLVPVPDGEGYSLLNTFLVYSGVLAVIAVLAVGTSLGINYTVSEVIIIAVIGSMILSVIGGLISTIGGVTNLSTYVVLRYSFGYIGSWVWSIIISGIPSGLGWFAVQTWFFGITVNAIAPAGSVWADVGVASIWGGFLMMLTAIYGYRGLSFLSYLAVPMFILIAIAGIMVGIDGTDNLSGVFEITPSEPGVPLSAGITALVGSYIVGATISMDIGRYSEKKHRPGIAWVTQIVILMPLMVVGASLLTLITGATDFAQAMLGAGLGFGVFLLAVFGFWTTNDNNLYSGALAWSIFLPLKKKTITALQGVIGTGIAAYVGFSAGASMDPFIAFLEILGIVLPAIAGVIIADFYIYRWWKGFSLTNRYQYEPGSRFGLIVWPGWVAVLAGAFIGGPLIATGIGSLNTLVLGALFHSVLMIGADVLGIPTAIGEAQIDETGRSPEIVERLPGGERVVEPEAGD